MIFSLKHLTSLKGALILNVMTGYSDDLSSLLASTPNIKDMSIISYKYKDNPIHQIPVNVKKINQIIGINISEKEYLNHLSKLRFDVEEGLR